VEIIVFGDGAGASPFQYIPHHCFSFFLKKISIRYSQPKMIVITRRIMIAATSFFIGYENPPQEDDSDPSNNEDEANQYPQILLSKQGIYKVL
jgi:hypothetical protein